MLMAASWVAPAMADTLAKPEETGGEKVKAPLSAPTTTATATKPLPKAQPKEGQDLVRRSSCPPQPLDLAPLSISSIHSADRSAGEEEKVIRS